LGTTTKCFTETVKQVKRKFQKLFNTLCTCWYAKSIWSISEFNSFQHTYFVCPSICNYLITRQRKLWVGETGQSNSSGSEDANFSQSSKPVWNLRIFHMGAVDDVVVMSSTTNSDSSYQ